MEMNIHGIDSFSLPTFAVADAFLTIAAVFSFWIVFVVAFVEGVEAEGRP